jgi:hypothetical protein
MTPISPQSWFLKCGIAAALALLVYAAIALAGPKAPPLPTSRDGALTILDRYVGEPVPDVLLVGSSLTARLNEEYFDTPNLKVLGLAGGSPITALDVALARDRLPGTILIEMNILDRGADPALVQKFRPGSAPIWPRPIRSAVALYERWHHAPPDRVRARAFAAALLQGLPSDFDNRIYVERALREWGTAPSDAIMTDNLATLQRLVDKIAARGSRVYFYTVPLSVPLQDSVTAKATAAAAHAEFSDDRQWIHLDGSMPDLRWADGVHLDERSAVIIARQIDRFLEHDPEKGAPVFPRDKR